MKGSQQTNCLASRLLAPVVISSLRLAVLLALGSSTVFAQLTRGFISGTVEDATGAVLPEVVVRATNRATNLTLETKTNEVGFYRFVGVEPGIYTLEFSKAGFETRRVENVSISTAQEVVINQTLAVAGTQATVEVTAAAPGVELAKATATIQRTLPQTLIENIPLTAGLRDINVLALLAPTSARGPGSTGISVNGNRARNNNFMLDGVDNNDLSVTLVSNRAIPEAIAEYQVQTSPYSAEFGRNTGGQLSAITRSGTNEFHGEVWNYYRGNWMEPVSLLNKRAGVTKTPGFVQNQSGGSIGGPIIRDRTFFFGLYESNIRREAPDARNAAQFSIPTAEGYALLRTVPLRPAQGNIPAQTPESRQAVLNAMRFLEDIYAQYSGLLQPANPVVINGVTIPMATGRIPLSNPHDMHYWVTRVDHTLTNAHRLSYRAHYDKRNQPDVVSNLQFGSRFSGAQTIFGQNHAASLVSTLSPRVINEFRASFVRRNLDFPENDPTSPTVGIAGAFTIGGASNFPQGRIQNTFQWQDVVTVLRGRHSLKFGADIRRYRLFNRSAFDSKGTWTFNSLADFVNNQAFSLRQAVNEATFDARQLAQYYFFQDDIKLTRDLTINIGIRYEYNDIPFGFFGAANEEIARAGVPRNVQPDKNNWAPRVGFAYSPAAKSGVLGKLLGDGRTVFRGGFGIGYDVLFYNILTVTASNPPRVVTSETFQPQTIDLFPRLAPKVSTPPPFDPLTLFVNANTDMQNPTSHYWSFTIQRELGAGHILEVGYSGNRGYHGIRQGQLNPGILTPEQAATVRATRNPNSIPSLQARRLNPAWGSRVTIESTALSAYHAGFVKYDKRFSQGLTVGAQYTFSGLWSDNDESLAVGDIVASSPQVPQDYFNYRNEWSRSVFDRPHRFSVFYLYQIPGYNLFSNPVLRHLLGGWQIGGFTEFQSGQPFTIRTGVDSGGTGTTAPFRPNYNPSGAFTKDPVEANLRTFRIPIDGTGIVVTPLTVGGLPLANSMSGGGNLGRNTFRGPGLQNWNFSLHKEIRISERWKVQLRSDWINLWNHRNFGNPVATMNSPLFGQNTTDPGGRTMLLSAKIRF